MERSMMPILSTFILRINGRHNVNDYVSCIKLLYLSQPDKCLSFSSVEKTLGILEVASDLLLQDCVDACMEYLEAVRWTPLEHVQIRDSLSALQINPQPDLAARLCTSKGEYLKIMEEVISKLLSLISNGAPQCTWGSTQKIISANIAANSSDALVDMTFTAILQETQSKIDIIASQLRRIQHFDSKSSQKIRVAKSAVGWFVVQCTGRKSGIQRSVKMFAHQLDLAQAILGRALGYNPFTETLLDILDGMANVMGNGDVICRRSIRLSFITTWLPVIRKMRLCIIN
eukprot:Gb_20507 [translate_table: standard]